MALAKILWVDDEIESLQSQKLFVILIGENIDGGLQLSVEFFVQHLHNKD